MRFYLMKRLSHIRSNWIADEAFDLMALGSLARRARARAPLHGRSRAGLRAAPNLNYVGFVSDVC